MPFSTLPGVLALRRVYDSGTLQPQIAATLRCSQAFVSVVLAGKQRLGPAYRGRARAAWGIAVEDWLTPEERGEESMGAHTASRCESPQAAQISSAPPFIGTAPEACPASQVTA